MKRRSHQGRFLVDGEIIMSCSKQFDGTLQLAFYLHG
jgi:hypothetical protein